MLRTRPAEPIVDFPRDLPPGPRRPRAPHYRVKNDAIYWRRRVGVLAVVSVVVLVPTVVVPRLAGLFHGKITLAVAAGGDGGSAATHTVDRAQLAALAFTATVHPQAKLRHAKVTVDGHRVAPVVAGSTLTWKPGPLADGRHTVAVSVARSLGLPSVRRSYAFTVDTKPPALAAKASAAKVRINEPVTFTGTVEDGARLTADGKPVKVEGGRFTVRYAAPPAGRLHLVATDVAGNTTAADVAVAIDVPPTRAVHVSGFAWATPSLRDPVLAMIDQGLINAVELDLKEEDGFVTYKSALPLPTSIGAVRGIYDLKKAVDQLHAKKVRVIGRLVAFRDPVFANAMWKAGKKDEVIQTPNGEMYTGKKYGAFSNFANPDVQRYNEDIAEEATRLGVDDVLYDYVRRPDGAIDSMRFPGLAGTPEDAVVKFLADTRARIRPNKALLGASVFGIASTRPTQIAQDIPKMAREVDYIAPMVYPSHWNNGEYGVADPNRQPYDIVQRSLQDFQKKVAGTDAKIVPWLQDFSLGVSYGPNEVAAQIKAAADDGIGDWIMWDPAVTYTTAGLPHP